MRLSRTAVLCQKNRGIVEEYTAFAACNPFATEASLAAMLTAVHRKKRWRSELIYTEKLDGQRRDTNDAAWKKYRSTFAFGQPDADTLRAQPQETRFGDRTAPLHRARKLGLHCPVASSV